MISIANSGTSPVTMGASDANNYIYIDTQLSDPYIMFYSTTAAASNDKIGGSSMEQNGISLKKAKINGDTTTTDNTSTYKIRLPKNAASFKIGNGATGNQSAAVALTGSVRIKSDDRTYYPTGDDPSMTITDYHHAGTTFTATSATTPVVSISSLRTGFTAPKQEMTQPLHPRTDSDYIFFTDTDGTFANSNTVYAYYYGGSDGEYAAWPGIKASTSDSAPLTYKDNNGKTVYMFQLPKDIDGKYPYVIFNNGAALSSGTKITQAIRIMNAEGTAYNAGGKNYTASGTVQHYGTYDSTSGHYVNALPTSSTDKSTEPTVDYSSNNYIYIVNNGTYGFSVNDDMTNGRYVLDEMHVIFYDANYSPVGTESGYIPDKVGTHTSGTVYGIQIPSGARYFRITNGQNKQTVTSSHNHYRSSEVKEIAVNGLYKFVDSSTTPSDIWDSSVTPTTPAQLNSGNYYLDLINEIEDDDDPPETSTQDVRLAQVETKDDGTMNKITWLKPDPEDNTKVDSKYLGNTMSDVGVEGKTEIKVKKMGGYYWKEVQAPTGYIINKEEQPFTILATDSGVKFKSVPDERIQTGHLKLQKNVLAGSVTEPFTYIVTLKNNSIDLTDALYLPASALTALGVNTSDPFTQHTAHYIKFKISVSGNSPVTITNVPFGTTYSVTEVLSDAQETDGWLKVTDSAQTGTFNGGLPEVSGVHTATATLSNIQLGTLTLAKKLATNPAGGNVPADNRTFTFLVTMVAPAGIDLNDYIEDFDDAHYTDWTETTSSNVHTYTFKQSFTNTNGVDPASVLIENIPYGTTYSVYELTTDTYALPAFVTTVNGDSSHAVTGEIGVESTAGAGDAASREAAITNTYKTKSLTIHKVLAGRGHPTDTAYSFTVTLTAPTGAALSNYTYKVDGVPQLLSGTGSNELNVTITGEGSAVITSIPYGAQYSVTETDPSDSSTGSIGTDGSTFGTSGRTYPSSGTAALNADGHVYFKNTYPDQIETGNLVLEKDIQTGTTGQGGTQFEYTVVLTAPSGMTFTYDSTNGIQIAGQTVLPNTIINTVESVQVQEVFSDTPTVGTDNTDPADPRSTVTFKVNVSDNIDRTISGIPLNTGYSVSETLSSTQTNAGWVKLTTASQTGTLSSSFTEVSGVKTETATIKNGLTGSLQITKTLSNTPPDSSESTPYEIKVTMTNPDDANFDWSKYSYSISSGGGTVSRTNNVLTISITGSGSKTISGIPYGTVCTVAETPVSNYTATVTYPNSGSNATVGSSTQTATVDNRYTDTGSLQITKSAPNQPSGMSGETYTVMVSVGNTYNDWGDVTFSPQAMESQKPASDPAGAEFAVTLTNGQSLTISGLPAGTAYTVREVNNATSQTTLTSSTYYRGYVTSLAITQGTGTVSSNQASGTLNTTNGLAQTVTVTNTYKQTGTLTLSKTINGAANADSDPSSDTFYL